MTPERLKRIIALHPDIDAAGRMSAPSCILRNRHNKVSIGMTKTVYRSCQSTSADANSLSVKGTTDRLGAARWMNIRYNPISKKFRLTESGKKKLARERRSGF